MKIQYKNVTLRQKLIVTYQKKLLCFINVKFAYFIVNRQQYTFKIKVNQQVHLKLKKKHQDMIMKNKRSVFYVNVKELKVLFVTNHFCI